MFLNKEEHLGVIESILRFSDEDVYVLLGITRKKLKQDTHKTVKRIVYSRNKLHKYMEEIDNEMVGLDYYLYITVNPSNLHKAKKSYVKEIIDNYDDVNYLKKLEHKWISILMKPNNQSNKKYLIDIDDKHISRLNTVKSILEDNSIFRYYIIETPNGYHIVVDRFDVRLLEGIDYVEVKKNALVFIDYVKRS